MQSEIWASAGGAFDARAAADAGAAADRRARPARGALAAGFERHGEDAAYEIVPGAGHFLPEERPALVAERALALLARSA